MAPVGPGTEAATLKREVEYAWELIEGAGASLIRRVNEGRGFGR